MPTTDCLPNSNHSISNITANQSQQQPPPPLTPQHNGPPHYVDLHVNAGEMVSLLVDGQEQLVAGPRTITMISQLQTPPVPIPVQVPPGHMIHQIADENGTLKHIILSIMDGEESPVINLPQGSFLIDPNGELVSTNSVPTEINTITTLPQQTNFANYDGCPVAFDATALPETVDSYGPTLISSVPPTAVAAAPPPAPPPHQQPQITSKSHPQPPPSVQPYANNYHHPYSNSHLHHHQPQQHYHNQSKSLNLLPPVYPNYDSTIIPSNKPNHVPQQQQVTTYRTAESDTNYSQRSNSNNSYNSGRHVNNENSINMKRQLILNDKQQLHNNRYNNNVKVITNNHVGMTHRTGNSVSPIRTRPKSNFYTSKSNKNAHSHSNSPNTHKLTHINSNPNTWYSTNKPPNPLPKLPNLSSTPTVTTNSPSVPIPTLAPAIQTIPVASKEKDKKEENQDILQDDCGNEEDDDDEEKRVIVVIDSPNAKQQSSTQQQTKTTSEQPPPKKEELEEARSSRVKQKKCQNQHRNHSLDDQKQHSKNQPSIRPDSLNERRNKDARDSISKNSSPVRNVTKSNRQETTNDLSKKSEVSPYQQLKHKNKHNSNNGNSGNQQTIKCDSAPKIRNKTKASNSKPSKVAQPVTKHHHLHQDQQQQQSSQQKQLECLTTSNVNRGNTSSHNNNSNSSSYNYNTVIISKAQPVKLSTLFRQCRLRFVSLLGKLVQDSLASCNDTKFASLLLIMFTLLAMLLALLIHVYIVAPVTE